MASFKIRKTGESSQYPGGVVIQPGYTLIEKNDGTIEGNVIFEASIGDLNNFPRMGDRHPRDSRCELYNREFTYLTLNKVRMTGSYFGLVSSKTNGIISYTPNTDKEPIELHPLFESFAGTRYNSKNGAVFDAEDGEFLGFYDQTKKELFGVRHYNTPSTMVSRTYWQSGVPNVSKRMSIVNSIPGFRKPSDVKDFLLLDIPYRQVGNFYQLTELYLGSGPNGFSKTIYP